MAQIKRRFYPYPFFPVDFIDSHGIRCTVDLFLHSVEVSRDQLDYCDHRKTTIHTFRQPRTASLVSTAANLLFGSSQKQETDFQRSSNRHSTANARRRAQQVDIPEDLGVWEDTNDLQTVAVWSRDLLFTLARPNQHRQPRWSESSLIMLGTRVCRIYRVCEIRLG